MHYAPFYAGGELIPINTKHIFCKQMRNKSVQSESDKKTYTHGQAWYAKSQWPNGQCQNNAEH